VLRRNGVAVMAGLFYIVEHHDLFRAASAPTARHFFLPLRLIPPYRRADSRQALEPPCAEKPRQIEFPGPKKIEFPGRRSSHMANVP
jgi:hypothetical protein